jgi:hypothetical protein
MTLDELMPYCPICHQRKKPIGRDVPVAGGTYCDHECPGYYQEPLAGYLWPGEAREETEESR